VRSPELLSRDELSELIAERDELIDQQAKIIVKLQQENVFLRQELTQQTTLITQLQEQLEKLNRRFSRNSKNSSMPPSSDDVLPGRSSSEEGEQSEPASGIKDEDVKPKKRGKQPGVKGTTLKPVDNPDKQESVYASHCVCGEALDPRINRVEQTQSFQQIDIPPVRAIVTQYNLHSLRCYCGHVNEAQLPAGVSPAPIAYGPNIQALSVYLMVAHAVPVERTASLIEQICSQRPSDGFVHGLLRRFGGSLDEFEASIKQLLHNSHVAHFDETTLRCGKKGKKLYVWGASNNDYTVYHLGRRARTDLEAFGFGQYPGIAVHDRYGLYDTALPKASGHQLCCAHLLRDLRDCAEVYPTAQWPARISLSMSSLIHATNELRDKQTDPARKMTIADEITTLITTFRCGVRDGLLAVPFIEGPKNKTKQLPGRNLLERLQSDEQSVLRFVHDLNVPPTNNLAERDVRPNKTQQKISGRLQSEQVTKDRLKILGYISTIKKHGDDVLDALKQVVLGNPWMPPVNTC
jgi:transposase